MSESSTDKLTRSEAINHPLERVWQCTNIRNVGWLKGKLLVIFYSSPTLYVYGPGVDEDVVKKLLANPYPNALFRKLLAKHQWKCFKIEATDDLV